MSTHKSPAVVRWGICVYVCVDSTTYSDRYWQVEDLKDLDDLWGKFTRTFLFNRQQPLQLFHMRAGPEQLTILCTLNTARMVAPCRVTKMFETKDFRNWHISELNGISRCHRKFNYYYIKIFLCWLAYIEYSGAFSIAKHWIIHRNRNLPYTSKCSNAPSYQLNSAIMLRKSWHAFLMHELSNLFARIRSQSAAQSNEMQHIDPQPSMCGAGVSTAVAAHKLWPNRNRFYMLFQNDI